MTYQIIDDRKQEEMDFHTLRMANKCCMEQMMLLGPDSLGHRIILLKCHECDSKSVCLAITRIMESYLNRRWNNGNH